MVNGNPIKKKIAKKEVRFIIEFVIIYIVLQSKHLAVKSNSYLKDLYYSNFALMITSSLLILDTFELFNRYSISRFGTVEVRDTYL